MALEPFTAEAPRATSYWMQPLTSGAIEHYMNPSRYDQRYAGRQEDVKFYAARARDWANILEWGAGSGRLTLPMAAAGAEVLAVDASQVMLNQLKEKLKEKPKLKKIVRTHCADMRTYTPRKKFDGVVAGFSTFCHLYRHEDIASVLKTAWNSLVPGGELVFDLPAPRTDGEGYDHYAQIFVSEIQLPQAGSSDIFVVNQLEASGQLLTQRIFHLQEMKMHLSYAGFEELEVLGDFEQNAPDADSQTLVFSARRPKT